MEDFVTQVMCSELELLQRCGTYELDRAAGLVFGPGICTALVRPAASREIAEEMIRGKLLAMDLVSRQLHATTDLRPAARAAR